MESTLEVINSKDYTTIATLLSWTIVLLLGVVFIVLLARLFIKLKGDNKVFYSEKGAINLRVDRLPDIRVATKNCKDFKLVVRGNTLILSYANPFGGVKEFKCNIVGDPVERGFMLTFSEEDFRKLCVHLKPGAIAVHRTKITFNYNLAVKAKFSYLKREV